MPTVAKYLMNKIEIVGMYVCVCMFAYSSRTNMPICTKIDTQIP